MAKQSDTPVRSGTTASLPADNGRGMVDLVTNYNWSKTPMGARRDWNPVVEATVNFCVHAKVPALLMWGSTHTTLYNDLFRDVTGWSDDSLGANAMHLFSSRWPETGVVIEQVFQNGQGASVETISAYQKNNFPGEELTLTFNPVFLKPGKVGGIIVFVSVKPQRTAENVNTQMVRVDQFMATFSDAPVALCLLSGPDFIIEAANDKILALWNKSRAEILNKRLLEAVPMAKNHGPQILEKVLTKGEPVIIEETVPKGMNDRAVRKTFIKFVYAPFRDNTGNIIGTTVIADDITAHVLARKEIEESEIRQKIAIDSAAIGTFDWNIIDGTFHYSDRLAQIFGFKETDTNLRQKDFGSRIHPDDQPERLAAHRNAYETGILFYEARVVHGDESVRWVRVNGKVIYNIDGKPSRMYGTSLDITEQHLQWERLEKIVELRTQNLKERNTQLQLSEERYHRMIDEVQDYAIILLNRDGLIQNWNKGAEKIKYYTESEIVGKDFRVFYLPEDRQAKVPERLIHDAVTTGRAVHEGWRLRKDGSKFWGSVAITALHNDNDEVIGFSKVTRDLTERKMAEDKLKAYTAELESQNRELEQFAYVASHDLQEPLRKIQTFCEVIQKNGNDEATQQRYFPKIISAAQRMTELIRSVLNYSRLSREGEMVPIDLNAIIANILNDYELLITEKKADVQVEPMPPIVGIPLQISQLLSNLLGNALKFTIECPVIRFRCRRVSGKELSEMPIVVPERHYLEISVEDNGIGFDQKYEKLIFAMFQRLNSKHEYAGTGIGLALCKKIAENHNGFIIARSEHGKGSTFFVYLPIE